MTELLGMVVILFISAAFLFWVWFIAAVKQPMKAERPDVLLYHLRIEVLKICQKYPDVFLENITTRETAYGVEYDLTFDIPHMDDRKMYAVGVYEQELLVDEAKVIKIIDGLIRNTFEKVV